MSDLKNQLIKLGSTNPELRPHIRKVLAASFRGKYEWFERTPPSKRQLEHLADRWGYIPGMVEVAVTYKESRASSSYHFIVIDVEDAGVLDMSKPEAEKRLEAIALDIIKDKYSGDWGFEVLNSTKHSFKYAKVAKVADPSRLRAIGLGYVEDAELVDNLPAGLEVYTFTTFKGLFAYAAVTSRANKPFEMYSYRTEADRDKEIARTIENWEAAQERKQQRKMDRKYTGGLNEGDILYTSWGYDQTNVEWFQVVGTPTPSTVEIREIRGKMQGNDKTVPDPNSFIGPVIKKRPSKSGGKFVVKLDTVRSAWQWDGRPKYVTPFGMGH